MRSSFDIVWGMFVSFGLCFVITHLVSLWLFKPLIAAGKEYCSVRFSLLDLYTLIFSTAIPGVIFLSIAKIPAENRPIALMLWMVYWVVSWTMLVRWVSRAGVTAMAPRIVTQLSGLIFSYGSFLILTSIAVKLNDALKTTSQKDNAPIFVFSAVAFTLIVGGFICRRTAHWAVSRATPPAPPSDPGPTHELDEHLERVREIRQKPKV